MPIFCKMPLGKEVMKFIRDNDLETKTTMTFTNANFHILQKFT